MVNPFSVSRSRADSAESESDSFSFDDKAGRHTHSRSVSYYGVSGKLTAGTGTTSFSWSVTHNHTPLNNTPHVHKEEPSGVWEVTDAPL